MNTLQIDFSQIPSRDPVAVGMHNAVVQSVEVRRNANDASKPPYLAWAYEIADGPDAGKLVFDNASVSTQALWRLHDIFEAVLGEGSADQVSEITFDDSGVILHPKLVGRPCELEIYHEEYEKQLRAKVRNVLPAKTSKLVKGASPGKVLK